jgi:hypothetical protein
MNKKNDRLLRKELQSMSDHDVLIEVALTQKYVESHLKQLNNSVAKNTLSTGENKNSIAAIIATCEERTKGYREVLLKEDKKLRNLFIAIAVIASASGALGSNIDRIIQFFS